MKQPRLEELRDAVENSADPLDIVNAFVVIPALETPSLPSYWEHRLCCLAEIIVETRNHKG